ncbi:uncharacterized protein [Musca autumnalis]|uniref:uncharacterized protein n=1 Tax=Musca autumnalis TaxID=221902 RepID=UPI003CEA9144
MWTQMRWNLYNILELWASGIGVNGHTCVLKSICEASQTPFNNDTGDIWHEVAHIIFSPYSSRDVTIDYLPLEYLSAAKVGLSQSCDQAFKECPKSLLQMLSYVL